MLLISRVAYLQLNDTNVFVVDWGKLASLPCYPAAVINTKFAAKCTADLLMKLEKKRPSTFRSNEIHGIGFSLGAHFISFVSNRMFKTNGRKLHRITGRNIHRSMVNMLCFKFCRLGPSITIFRNQFTK